MSEVANFDHGMVVISSRRGGVVHAPRWWQLVAHVRWLVARARGRTIRITLMDGSTLRLIERPPT